MLNCPVEGEAAIISGGPPPTPGELDATHAANPWTLRHRLTMDAYAVRCRAAGQQPTDAGWLGHIGLDAAELELVADLIEVRRASDALELGPKFVLREYGNKARVGWFDERGELVTMSFAEFKNAHIEKVTQVGTNDKGEPVFKPLVQHWLEHRLTPRYDRADFRPGVAQADMPEGLLNLWRGWPRGLKPGWHDYRSDGQPITDGPFDRATMPEGHCDLFLEHMLNAMCGGDEDVMHYLLGWMADALWNPGPSEAAVALRGPEGSGKSLWAQHFMQFFGIHALTLDDEKHVLGNFNKQLMNKSVIFAEEAFFAGNKAQSAKLKSLVTSPDLFVEPKGVDGFSVPKMFRIIMASNEEHVISAGRDDRRYLVLNVDAGPHNQEKVYFSRLVDEWNSGGRRALFRWLTGAWWGRAVGGDQHRQWARPITAALAAQKDMSLAPAQMIVHNMLSAGEVPGLHATDDKRGLVFVATRGLADAGRISAERERALGDALCVLAGAGAKSVRFYLGEGHARRQWRGFWLPPLDVCRGRWEAHLGRAVQWPTSADTWGLEAAAAEPDDDLQF